MQITSRSNSRCSSSSNSSGYMHFTFVRYSITQVHKTQCQCGSTTITFEHMGLNVLPFSKLSVSQFLFLQRQRITKPCPPYKPLCCSLVKPAFVFQKFTSYTGRLYFVFHYSIITPYCC